MEPIARRCTAAALLVALLATSAACGARWTDEQHAQVGSGGRPVLEASTVAGGVGTAGRATAPAGGPTGPSVRSGGAAVVVPDDEVAPPAEVPGAGGASAGGEQGAAALPCAAPSDAPGVAASEITVLAVSAMSGPVPGLGATAAAATRSHVAYRNATGGVCGRQIVLREADDGTDTARYRSIVQEEAPKVFGIAGGFTVGDAGAADVLSDTGIPVLNTLSSDDLLRLLTVFDINPPYDDPAAVNAKYRFLHAQGAREVAFVYIAVDQSRQLVARERAQLEAAGLEVVLVHELPLSTLSYDSAARRVADSGADYMIFISSVDGNAAMARSMSGIDHGVTYPEYYSFAYPDLVENAGAEAAEGAVTWLRTRPNFDADINPETAAFVEWMERIAPGIVPDQYAADSWTATKAFFDALERVPGPLSREAFVAALRATERFDAGGMMGGIRLGRNLTNGCLVGLQVVSGTWRRVTPGTDFLC